MPQGSPLHQTRIATAIWTAASFLRPQRTPFTLRRTAAWLAAAALCGVIGDTAAATSQGLTGTTLRPIQDGEALVTSLIDMFAGDKDAPRPAFTRVVVTEDAAQRLVVTVAYSGLPNVRLEGEVTGRDRRPQPEVQTPFVSLTEAAGEATLALELRGGASQDAPLESAYLRLTAVNSARPSVRVLTRVYALPKTWRSSSGASPPPQVLGVSPEPIGTARGLGDRPNYTAPPRVLVPITPPVARPAGTVRDHRTGAVADPRVRDHRARRAAQPPPTVSQGGGVMVSDSVAQQRRETAKKTKAASNVLASDIKLVQIEQLQYGVKPEDVQKGALGPAAAPIELLEGLSTEDIGLSPATLLSIATNIYPDKNAASGVFYYHPRSYHLAWTPEAGHGMRILYGASAGSAAAGDVLMAARLQSGLDLAEVQLARDLLQAYRRRNPSAIPAQGALTLRPLPLQKGGVDVSIAAVLGQYSIAKEKVAITGLSDVLGEIEVSWITDPVTKENLQLALMQDIGVSGSVAFAATGGELAPQVPISIQLADRDSFGRVRWNRAEGYHNNTPYPVRLRYLHALIVDPVKHLPILYTWTLGDTAVAPGARVDWTGAGVPAWIDTTAKRLWIDYAVVESCDECDKQVLDRITGGVSAVTADQITFHTITPLADVGGYELTAHVRSKYFDPKDRGSVQKSIVLKADNQDFVLKPIFNVERSGGEPLFEYRLELAMPDGTLHKGTRWIPSDGVRVLIGRAQLEQSIGILPGEGK